MSALNALIHVTPNVSCKQRKNFDSNLNRREPVMTKTKIVAEAMLMRSMTETGKPY